MKYDVISIEPHGDNFRVRVSINNNETVFFKFKNVPSENKIKNTVDDYIAEGVKPVKENNPVKDAIKAVMQLVKDDAPVKQIKDAVKDLADMVGE
jgi:hypothetical protein